MRPLDHVIVRSDATVRAALELLNKNAMGVLLMVDAAGKLLRTVTDGDLRRLLLAGSTMDGTIRSLPDKPPRSAPAGADDASALAIMNDFQVDHLPAVDGRGAPTGLFLRRDLDARILLSSPHLGEQEMEFVNEAFRSNWIAPLGPNVDAFEKEVAKHAGVGFAAATSSGTAAIHLGLLLLGVEPGDTVFCSTFTFAASAFPIVYQGAKPVFIDSEPGSWNMSPAALERALGDAIKAGKKPKAVVIVNLYGQSADFDPLLALCDKHGVPVLEDAAESLGATYKKKASGSLGKLGVFSFNGNKIITTSGGGMLVGNDAKLIEKACFLSTQARDPQPWYEHTHVGYNYRMSNVLAGIGRGQLRVLGQRVDARRAVFDRYVGGLLGLPGVNWMPESSFGRSNRWLSVMLLDPAKAKLKPGEVIRLLADKGVEARRTWKPMHRQPIFAGAPYFPHAAGESFSDRAFDGGICLPSGSNMTEEQQDRVIRALRDILQG